MSAGPAHDAPSTPSAPSTQHTFPLDSAGPSASRRPVSARVRPTLPTRPGQFWPFALDFHLFPRCGNRPFPAADGVCTKQSSRPGRGHGQPGMAGNSFFGTSYRLNLKLSSRGGVFRATDSSLLPIYLDGKTEKNGSNCFITRAREGVGSAVRVSSRSRS